MVSTGIQQNNATPALPAGGTAGQVLSLASPGVLGWSTPAGPAPWLPVSGQWFDTRLTPYNHGTTGTFNGSWTFLVPFFVAAPLRIDQIGTYLTSSVTGTNYYSVWTSDAVTAMPAQYLGGAAVAAAQGANVGACSITLPAGWLWAGVGSSSNSNYVTAIGASVRSPRPMLIGGNPGTNINVLAYLYYVVNGGNLPGVTTSYPTPLSNGANGPVPVIWFRAA